MSYIDITIDKLTHSIENVVTGESFSTEVLPLAKPDLEHLTKRDGWKFSWKKEYQQPDRSVFKLTIAGEPTVIHGLVSLGVKEDYVEMYLIENAPSNFGKNKTYSGVAGNLVAFVCKRSVELGFDGFVGFTAKTALIEHYATTLGAVPIGGQRMAIWEAQAQKLIDTYFNSNDNDKRD
jgi:hypothetical protein